MRNFSLFRSRCFLAAALSVIVMPIEARAATSESGIIPQSTALRHGLVRAWYAHVEIDRTRDRVVRAEVDGDSLFFQSELGLVEHMDAATGRSRWIREVGRPLDPILPLDASQQWVAVLGGSRLYLLDRATGRVAWVRRPDGVPSTGPSISGQRVYVPLMRGPLESFEVPPSGETDSSSDQQPHRTFPWKHYSSGRSEGGVLITPKTIAWATDRGYLYVSEINSRQPLFRVEIADRIVTPLAYREPLVYGASLGGFVYAMDDTTGKIVWRVPLGSPIHQRPALVRDRLYICPDQGAMVCLDAKSGKQLWASPHATRFLAASPTRLYAIGGRSRLAILDIQSGMPLGAIPADHLTLAIANVVTDRIYLGTPSGAIQCLHEIDLSEPVRHTQAAAKKEPAAGKASGADGAQGAPDEATGRAPEGGTAPDQRDPFGGEEVNPFGGEDRDPFGDAPGSQ